MDYKEFVQETVGKVSSDSLEALKKDLVIEYITFHIIDYDSITMDILCEKLCDYFEKLEIKTGKTFDKQIDTYIDNLCDIVERRIAKAPQARKNSNAPADSPRTRKYFNQALSIKNTRTKTTGQLIDFTRIVLCLYTAAKKSNRKLIYEFDYSKECLDKSLIIDSMKKEKESPLVGKRHNKFEIKDPYCSDTCTFILTTILLNTILDD